jgi:hypothetical protein
MRRIVMLAVLLVAGSGAGADLITTTVSVRAYIDGQDYLHIAGSQLRWEHKAYSAVGLHGGSNHPTVLTTTLDGAAVMDGYEWTPAWPDGTSGGKWSSPFDGLTPAVPGQAELLTVNVVRARGSISVLQGPSEANGWETVLDFNDKSAGMADWYEVELTYRGTPEPASLAAMIVAAGALLRRRR